MQIKGVFPKGTTKSSLAWGVGLFTHGGWNSYWDVRFGVGTYVVIIPFRIFKKNACFTCIFGTFWHLAIFWEVRWSGRQKKKCRRRLSFLGWSSAATNNEILTAVLGKLVCLLFFCFGFGTGSDWMEENAAMFLCMLNKTMQISVFLRWARNPHVLHLTSTQLQ